MKRCTLFVQSEAVREVFKDQVRSIGKLIRQRENLEEIMRLAPESQAKEDFVEEMARMEESISDLIAQTVYLLDRYNDFADTVFSE